MHGRTAFTLIELIVVLVILTALSGVVIPIYSGTLQNGHEVSTTRTLNEVRDALTVYWNDTKLVVFDGISTVATEEDRVSIRWLFVNPVTGDRTNDYSINTRIGWRGPYLRGATGDQSDAIASWLIDPWNRSIVVQDVDSTAIPRDIRVVSGGPNGTIDTPTATATVDLTSSDVGDDKYVAFFLR